MLSTDAFKAFGERVVLFLHNTSLLKDEPYPDLLREKGGNAFPTVAFLDHTGRLLTQQPNPTENTAQLDATLGRLHDWQKLRAKVEGGDGSKRAELFMTELDFGMMEYAGSRQRLARVERDLTKAQRQRVETALVEMEFQSVARTITQDPNTMAAAGKRFAAMIDQDRIPRSRQVITFWQAALAYAYSRKDVGHFEKIFERAKKEMAGDPRAARYVRRIEAQLRQLRRQQGSKR